MLNDTIVAIATPLQVGAISIIKLSGQDAIRIASKVCCKDFNKVASHTINYGFVYDNKVKVDEVLVSLFRAPKSYTCEDVVEINCHGGIYVTKKILALCIGNGARLAINGEFSKRAFLNNRIDLSQVEGTMDLIEARSEVELKMALSVMGGSVNKLIRPFIASIEEILAHIEVNIDYPEYDDIKVISKEEIKPRIDTWLSDIDNILETSDSGQKMKDGIKTVIIGKPNVGKSSLLNALLNEEKAIVSDIEGTTRDIVEGYVVVGGIPLCLNDTAGLRQAQDDIEKIGISKSNEAIKSAQLVILLLDATKVLDEHDKALIKDIEQVDHLIVYNKIDMINNKVDGIGISAKDNNISALINTIVEKYENIPQGASEAHLINDRQIGYMLRAKDAMKQAKQALDNGVELDLIAIDLQKAYEACKEILGENAREDLLDVLFKRFCVGK